MIKHIVAFGDSNIAGNELPFCEPAAKAVLDNAFPDQQLDHTGSIPPLEVRFQHYEKLTQVTDRIPDYDQKCWHYSIVGYLARSIGVPYTNHAFGGYSNDAIMAELLKKRSSIDSSTLVIVGMTFPARETQLNMATDHGRIKCFSNYHQFAKNPRHEKFLASYLEWSNDLLTKFIQVRNHISSIKEILAGIPHVIIDPWNIYRESPDIVKPLFDWDHTQVVSNSISQAGEHIAHPDIVESVQQYFNDNLFAYTFHHAMIDVHARNEPCRCLLGHPNRASHEQMVDAYLMPWLRTQGII